MNREGCGGSNFSKRLHDDILFLNQQHVVKLDKQATSISRWIPSK